MIKPSAPKHPLQELLPLLKHVGFYPLLVSPKEHPKHPYTRLLVSVEDCEQPIEMILLQELTQAAARQAKVSLESGGAGLLRFILRLPMSLSPEQTRVIPLVLLSASRNLVMGAWSMNDADGVYLEYTLAGPTGKLPGPVVVELLEKLFWSYQQQGPLLQAWAAGQKSLMETLANLQSDPVEVA